MPALFFFAIVPSTLWGRASKAVRFPTHVPHNEFLPCWNLLFHSAKIPYVATRGRVAQLGERIVRNDEVAGSIPVSSTKFSTTYADFRTRCSRPGWPVGSTIPVPTRSAQAKRNARSL